MIKILQKNLLSALAFTLTFFIPTAWAENLSGKNLLCSNEKNMIDKAKILAGSMDKHLIGFLWNDRTVIVLDSKYHPIRFVYSYETDNSQVRIYVASEREQANQSNECRGTLFENIIRNCYPTTHYIDRKTLALDVDFKCKLKGENKIMNEIESLLKKRKL